jgi:hypothetical protein
MAGTGPVPCAARPDQPLQVTDVNMVLADNHKAKASRVASLM